MGHIEVCSKLYVLVCMEVSAEKVFKVAENKRKKKAIEIDTSMIWQDALHLATSSCYYCFFFF